MPFYLIILLSIIVLVIISLVIARSIANRKKVVHDHRSHITPNNTNYNIASPNSEAIKNATPEEAKEILDKIQDGDLSSLSNGDYYLLKDKLGKS